MPVRRLLIFAAPIFCACPVSAAPVSPEAHWFGIPPVFLHRWGEDDAGTRMSSWDALLLWKSEHITAATGESAARWSLFPLLYFERTPVSDISYVFPFFATRRGNVGGDRGRSLWGLIPILFRVREHAPGYEMKRWWIAPVYRHTVDQEPVDGEGDSLTVRDWGLFPFTWGWTNGAFHHINLLYPLFSWKRGESLWITPLLWWADDYLIFGPIWGQWRGSKIPPPQIDPERVVQHLTEWHLLFPLYMHTTQRRGEEELHREHTVLWPLIAWGNGGGRTERRLFPLWRRTTRERGEAKQTKIWALTPIFWHGRLSAGGELYRAHDVVFPLLWDFRWREFAVAEEGAETPLRERKRHLLVIFPLWVQEIVDGHTRALHIAGPLFSGEWGPSPAKGEDLPAAGEVREHRLRLALLLAGHRRLSNGDTGLDVLWPLFTREQRNLAVKTRTLLLLFATDRDPVVDTARAALLWRLIEYTREGDDRGLRLFYLPWRIPLP